MAAFGELKPFFGEVARYLRIIATNSCNGGGGGGGGNVVVTNPVNNPVNVVIVNDPTPTVAATSAGANNSITSGRRSVAIVKTSVDGVVNITLSNGSIFPLDVLGEVFVDSASENSTLPAYNIASVGGATWKWHSIA